MRHVVLLLVLITFALVGFSAGAGYMLKKSAGIISTQVKTVQDRVNNGQWDKAGIEIKKVQHSWTGTKKWWASIIDHHEIDNIDQSLARASEYIKASDKTESLAELAVLKLFVAHIPEKESLNMGNIF